MQVTVPEPVTVGRVNVRVKATVLHLTSVSLKLVASPLHERQSNSFHSHIATPCIGPLLSLGVCASLFHPLLCNPSSSYRVSGGSDQDFPSKSQKTNPLIWNPPEKKTGNPYIGKVLNLVGAVSINQVRAVPFQDMGPGPGLFTFSPSFFLASKFSLEISKDQSSHLEPPRKKNQKSLYRQGVIFGPGGLN